MRNNNICDAGQALKGCLCQTEKITNKREIKKTLSFLLDNNLFRSRVAFAFFKPFSFLIFSILSLFPLPAAYAADIALIIDDIGYKSDDISAFTLPSEVTFSILPHTPYSLPFSQLAEQQQREVMMHVPMEALSGKTLGPGALTSDMMPKDIKASLEAAHESVPNAIAVNNHMGSKLTQLTLPMTATMEYLNERGLYFVDSRTTRYSRAEQIADKVGVPHLHRHVFLDHLPEPKHIAMQFKRLRKIANKYGQAVGIAHPHPQTLSYLRKQLPKLAQQGIRLVPLSDLMLGKHGQLAMNQYREKTKTTQFSNTEE